MSELNSKYNKYHIRTGAFLISSVLLLQGCASPIPIPQMQDAEQAQTAPVPVVAVASLGMGEDISYSYIPQQPSIITDRVGYLPTAKKVIYMEEIEPDREFSIIDTSSDEIVYVGHLHKISDDKVKEGEKAVYIGDFSEFSTEGSYRVFQPDVGYSYEFDIGKNGYHEIYEAAYKTITEAEYIQTSALIYTLSNLMLTREIYTSANSNDGFISGGINLLLTQQHPRTGAVYQELQTADTLALIEQELNNPANATIQTDSMVSLAATAELAGVLAQYYCDFYEDDQATAVAALRAAGKAYNYVDRFKDSVPSDSLYYAACELYRATGQFRYKQAISDYDMIPEQTRTCSDYNYTMLADVAYLSSNYKTDYIRCETLMAGYSDKASDISKASTKQTYYVQDDIEELSEDAILYNMMTLGLVSYVLSGREYASVQSNYLHYLFGINANKTNYYTEPMEEGGKPLNTDIVRLSKLIFILANRE